MVNRLNGRFSVIVREHAEMAFKSKKHADEDQACAVADWQRSCERDYSCAVRIVSTATESAGRLAVRVEACDVVGERLVCVRVRRKSAYPNSSATSYLGHLLKELIALHKDLEEEQAFRTGVSSNPAV